jgi:hypothetical protein
VEPDAWPFPPVLLRDEHGTPRARPPGVASPAGWSRPSLSSMTPPEIVVRVPRAKRTVHGCRVPSGPCHRTDRWEVDDAAVCAENTAEESLGFELPANLVDLLVRFDAGPLSEFGLREARLLQRCGEDSLGVRHRRREHAWTFSITSGSIRPRACSGRHGRRTARTATATSPHEIVVRRLATSVRMS